LRNLPCSRAELRRRLADAWQADEQTNDWPQDEVRRLVVEKYATGEWNRRR
jgi:hypothetical protein